MGRIELAFLTAVGLALASGAEAQSSGRGTSFGVLGGATFSKVVGSDVEAANLKTRTSFAVGVFGQIGLSRNFAIEPQLLYLRKGAKANGSGVDFAARLSYLELPVLATLRFPPGNAGGPGLFLQAGPSLAVKLQCRLSVSNGTTTIATNCEDVTPDPVQIKSTDLGFVFGAGVDVRWARILARYELGLSKIDDSAAGSNAKNAAFVLLAGWSFRTPH